jgi:hypothetical protein
MAMKPDLISLIVFWDHRLLDGIRNGLWAAEEGLAPG